MKKLTLLLALSLTAALPAAQTLVAAPAEAGRSVQVSGWIVDDWCRSGNAKPEGKTCTLDCHAKGAALVLFEPATGKVYRLDDQAGAVKNVGRVKVTGTLAGEALKVSRFEPQSEEK